MVKKIVIMFGSNGYENTLIRHSNEFKILGIFDDIHVLQQKDISEFIEIHRQYIIDTKRGFGCYIWKPYVILKVLETIAEGDILLWSDAGCIIHNKSEEVNDFIDAFEKSDMPLTAIGNSKCSTICYTKTDLFTKMDVQMSSVSPSVYQVETNRIIFKKCATTMEFVQQWLAIATEDYHNIDDSPSIEPNHPAFVEHRHDQSIFSILWYKYNMQFLDNYEHIANTIWIAARLRFI